MGTLTNLIYFISVMVHIMHTRPDAHMTELYPRIRDFYCSSERKKIIIIHMKCLVLLEKKSTSSISDDFGGYWCIEKAI